MQLIRRKPSFREHFLGSLWINVSSLTACAEECIIHTKEPFYSNYMVDIESL